MKTPPGRAAMSFGPPAAFLLAQLGAHAASRFAAKLSTLDLAPPHAGILRILAGSAGMTQQSLAEQLGMPASRLVSLVDDLESRDLLERRSNAEDRRRNALHLTAKGRSTLQSIGRVAQEHQASLLSALTHDEQRQLASLLQRIATQQGLADGVHPGFARWGGPPQSGCGAPAE